MTKCETVGHRYAKFDDATVFCRRCGEQKVMDLHALIAQFPAPIYLPCPGPHSPVWPNYRWYWDTTTGSTTTGNITVGDTVYEVIS